MPLKITGVRAVKRNVTSFFKDISEKKAPQFANAVLSIGLTHSKELTPIEFSNLINSTITNVDITPTGVIGTVTYTANYAAALEFGKWKPKPINEKAGPAWNPDAEPHFLKKGFEDPESRAAIKKAEQIFKI